MRILAFTVVVAAWALALSSPPERLDAQDAGGASVAPDALSAAQQGPVRVIVELTEEPLRISERTNRGALRARISAAQSRVLAALPANEFTLTHRYAGLPGFAGEIDAAGLQRLASDPRVKSIVLDRPVYGALVESIPLINADDVRDGLNVTGTGFTVAVLDSGADLDHPDIVGSIAFEECWLVGGTCPGGGTHTSGTGSAEDDHGHGTHVTGIITSNGVVAEKGVVPDAQIGAYKILNSANAGWVSDFDAAMADVIANHSEVDAVNMSLVDNFNHVGGCDGADPMMTGAINTLRANGVPTFVSSGNNNFTTGITWPSCISNAIAVGSVHDTTIGVTINFSSCSEQLVADQVACYSNSAPEVDVLAPGTFVVAPGIGGGLATFTGTSMAAPHATGVGIQLKQIDPALTVSQIETLMETTGVPRTDPKNGLIKPRLDAWAAALAASDPDGDLLPDLIDNCPDDYNPTQVNNDRNLIDLTPPKGYDDVSRAMSDLAGDACDPDDDNDGRLDTDEIAGTACGAFTTPTNPMAEDSDGDRVIDGWECTSATNPADSGSAPSLASCQTSVDADGDAVFDTRERCYFGTSTTPITGVNSDGDTLDDSCEIASINADQTVNVIDLQQIQQHTAQGGQGYLLNMDLNRDGTVNVLDLSYAAARSIPCP